MIIPLINPYKKESRMTKKKRRRKSPAKVSRKKRTRPVIYKKAGKFYRSKKSRTFKSPTMINPRRRKSRRKVRKNPALNIKGIFTKNRLMNAANLGIGAILAVLLKPVTYRYGGNIAVQFGRFYGGLPALLGALMIIKGKSSRVKTIWTGMVTIGIYDLVASNISALGMNPVTASPPFIAPQTTGASYQVGASYQAAGKYGTQKYSPPPQTRYYQTVGSDDPYAEIWS